MARKHLVALTLVLVAGFIAMVRAQDAGRRFTLDRAEEPGILQVAGEDADGSQTRSILRKGISPRTSALGERFQSTRRQGTAPPDAPVELSVDSGEAIEAAPVAVPLAEGDGPGEVPSVLKRKLNKSGTGAPKPAAAEPTSLPPATPTSEIPSGSSRRTATLPRSTPSVPPTEDESPTASEPEPVQETPVRPAQPSAKNAAKTAPAALLGSAGPAISVQVTGPKSVVIGKPAPYVVTLVNQSNIAAEELQVRIALPPWAVAAAAAATAGETRQQDDPNGPARLVWVVPQLEGRSQQQLNLQIVARESRPIELGVDWFFRPIAAVAQIEVQQPQLEISLSGSKDVLFGTNLTYVITLANPGNGNAENVVTKLTAGQGAPEMIQVGLIPAGQQKQIEVQLSANQAGTMRLQAVATGDGNLTAEVVEQILVRRANLQLAVTGPKLKFAGADGSYQMRIANTGNATAEDVVATIALPGGAKVTALTDGGKQSVNGIAWRIGNLAPNTERSFEVRCELTAAGENAIEIRAQGAGGLAAAETIVTRVEALADLKLTVNEPKGPRSLSEEVQYELVIINRGTKAAEQVQVVVHFSEGLEPIAADGGQAELVAGQAAFQPIARIEAGQQVVLKVRANADRPGNHRFRAEVQCAEPETRLLSEGTTRFFGDDDVQTPAPRTSRVTPQPAAPNPTKPAGIPAIPVSSSAANKKR